jgi:response regulator RpfG family c-di-GMP phosphodiesterase
MLAHALPRSTEARYRLLYLGSDLELVAALQRVLTKPDYRLVTCSDRESAILFLKSEIPYHLLLIDLEWRGREGLKLARLAHSMRHRKRIPIILLAAAESNNELQALARRAGVTEFVKKTPAMDAVSETILQIIER